MTHFQQRAERVRSEIKDLGLSMAEVARRIDYGSEAGTAYVRQVLNAQTTSNPILDLVEEALSEERSRRATHAA